MNLLPRTLKICFGLSAVLASASSDADTRVYSWTDTQGITHFAKRAPQGHESRLIKLAPSRQPPQPAAADSEPAYTGAPLDCRSATQNGRNAIMDAQDDLHEQWQAGRIDSRGYSFSIHRLNRLEQMMSTDRCETAEGKQQRLFACFQHGEACLLTADEF